MPVALPCLCLDGTRRERVRGGVWDGQRWIAELEIEGNPADIISPLVEGLLNLADLSLKQLGSIAVNLGPGSILGIRATAVSAATWAELLKITAHGWSGHRAAAFAAAGTCEGIVSEGRDGHWVLQATGRSGPEGSLREVEPAQVSRLQLRPLLGGFRHTLPPTLGEPVDAWPSLPEIFSTHGLPGLTTQLEALNAPGVYALWSGTRHPKATL